MLSFIRCRKQRQFHKDSYTDVSVDDEVVIYYNGEIAESDPLQINTVYAITLKKPANQSVE